jgi:CheY-like chemotaxis protein
VTNNSHTNALILVVEDVDETRYGMEKLLKTDGYRVSLARHENEGIESAQQNCPDLILVSIAGSPNEIIMAAKRIREAAHVGARVPVVIFWVEGIEEGEEVGIDQNVHLICPDNFNQLRGLMVRLLGDPRFAQTHKGAQQQELNSYE